MKALYLGVVVFAGVALGGCHGRGAFREDTKQHHGRYTGVGIYSADRMWSEIAVADKPKDKAAALTADDQNVIVVVDGDTGEIRQCGNLSGYCVGMNPWTGPLAKSQTAPLGLSTHAAELSNESAVSNEAEPADNVAEALPAKH